MGTVSTLKVLYTWEKAKFKWGAVQCVGETWKNFGIYSHDRSDTHSISIGEKKRFGRTLYTCIDEKIKPSEQLLKGLNKSAMEKIITQETYWDLINYLLKVVENAKIADNNTNSTAYIRTEFEKVIIADKKTIRLSSLTLEQVAMIDQALRHVEYHSGFAENFNAGEGYAAYYTERQQEEFHTKDKKFHAADGVLADVAVKKGAMDMDAFKILVNQPAGYEHFIPYIVGEYEYQKALVRLSIEAGSAGAEPAVYDAVIHVDIDDTVDRGKTAITDTSKATRIHFSKHYYTKPEVAVALYSGNTKDGAITPNITDIDKDDAGYYFEVELLKDDYTRTTGTISWQAIGY